jgi:hypothetical protein
VLVVADSTGSSAKLGGGALFFLENQHWLLWRRGAPCLFLRRALHERCCCLPPQVSGSKAAKSGLPEETLPFVNAVEQRARECEAHSHGGCAHRFHRRSNSTTGHRRRKVDDGGGVPVAVGWVWKSGEDTAPMLADSHRTVSSWSTLTLAAKWHVVRAVGRSAVAVSSFVSLVQTAGQPRNRPKDGRQHVVQGSGVSAREYHVEEAHLGCVRSSDTRHQVCLRVRHTLIVARSTREMFFTRHSTGHSKSHLQCAPVHAACTLVCVRVHLCSAVGACSVYPLLASRCPVRRRCDTPTHQSGTDLGCAEQHRARWCDKSRVTNARACSVTSW